MKKRKKNQYKIRVYFFFDNFLWVSFFGFVVENKAQINKPTNKHKKYIY